MITTTRTILLSLGLSLVLAACGASTDPVESVPDVPPAPPHPLINVTEPQADAIVSSPLTVKGEARGPWYFEASFPVRLYDDVGTEIAVGVAQAQGEWM